MEDEVMTIPAVGLPDLSSEYRLTDEQKAVYRRDGHVLLRSVLSPEEVAAYREVFRATIRKQYPNPKPIAERDVFNRAFLSLTNTFWTDPETRGFIYSRRLAKIAADLMGVDGVRIFHNQVFFKEVGGGPTPWHQDHFYWPIDTQNMATVWVPLVDITPEMGALRFATGSHRLPFLDEQGITEDAMAHFDRIIAERGLPVVTDSLQAGDVTVHAGWTLHSAAANGGSYAREVSAISYYEDGAYIMKELTQTQRQDLEWNLPGPKPGELAVGDRNPLLYRRNDQSDRA